MYKKYWCYTPTEFVLHRYSCNNGVWTEINLDDDITNKYGGAYCVKSTEYEIDPLPNRLDYTDSFWINQTYNDDDSHLMYRESSNLKLIEIIDNSASIIINSDYKLCLNWEAAVIVNLDGLMYPDGDINDLFDNVSGTPQFSFIFSLQIGNYYYNGSTWGTNFSTFNVNCEAGGDFISSYVEAENTGNFLYGVDLEGYLINIDRVLIGNPKLTVYNANAYYFDDMLGINFSKVNPRSFMLKNITLEAQKIDRSLEREKKDTLYTNVNNDTDKIKELDDVECKLTTKNDSQLSFSKLIYNGDFLDKCSNNINNSSQKLEELLVERNIEQYSNFKLKIEQNFSNSLINPNAIMHNNYLNRDFYIIGQNYDIKQNNNQLTLISK